MDWVALARTLATEAHTGQIDKAGQPYICHVARVAAATATRPPTRTATTRALPPTRWH